jgi:signal transduction histidine kinase
LGTECREAAAKGQECADKLSGANLAVEEFVCAVAHDLRDPLSAICGFTEVLIQNLFLLPKRNNVGAMADGVQSRSGSVGSAGSERSTGSDQPPRQGLDQPPSPYITTETIERKYFEPHFTRFHSCDDVAAEQKSALGNLGLPLRTSCPPLALPLW